MKTLLLAVAFMLTGCTSDMQELNYPIQVADTDVQPVAQAVEAGDLQIPQGTGTMNVRQLWVAVQPHPQPVLELQFEINWTGDADGYDVIVAGEYEATVTGDPTYTFNREHFGELQYTDLETLIPVVRIRAWDGAGSEVVSVPITWIY